MCIARDARDGSVYVADYGVNSVLKNTDILVLEGVGSEER